MEAMGIDVHENQGQIGGTQRDAERMPPNHSGGTDRLPKAFRGISRTRVGRTMRAA